MPGNNDPTTKILADVAARQKQAAAAAAANPQAAAAAAAANARPAIPTLSSPLTASGGLANQYMLGTAPQVTAGQLDPKALAANPEALNALRDRALATGDSPWLKMQLDQQHLGELTANDQAGGVANSQAALARSQMAMHGGLSSGASERAGTNAARDLSLARAGIARGGQVDRLNLGIADDTARTGILGQVAGLDLQGAAQNQDMNKFNISSGLDAAKYNSGQVYDSRKTNIANTLGAMSQQNQDKLGTYAEQMKGYAANQTAAATSASGKK